jgi:hypothetical protein
MGDSQECDVLYLASCLCGLMSCDWVVCLNERIGR